MLKPVVLKEPMSSAVPSIRSLDSFSKLGWHNMTTVKEFLVAAMGCSKFQGLSYSKFVSVIYV